MPTNILMPALSPTMSEGNLAKWHVKVGDEVHAGDVVAEIETDKATMEVEAVDEGRVGKIVVPEGAEGVQVNSVIAVLLGEGEDESAIKESAPPAAKADETPKAEAKPKAETAAPTPAKAETSAAAPPPPAAQPSANGQPGGRVFASPLARRLAKESGIDLVALSGSGPHGRIVKADVEGARGRGRSAAPAAQPSAARGLSDDQILQLYDPEKYEVIPHDNVRKIIARRLVEAKQTIPHFYLTVATEIDALLRLRSDLNDTAPKDEDGNPAWKISVNDLVIKALAKALIAVPKANATWTEGGMLRHRQADIGVAVAIPDGLITPIVRNADSKSIVDIANEMKDLAGRARQRRLKPEEYQGGSTAVSNLGMYGIKEFAAVINPPHSSILAIGAGIQTPVVRDGRIEVATIMEATLSTDHRAVDGVLGAELLTAFRTFIAKPAALLL